MFISIYPDLERMTLPELIEWVAAEYNPYALDDRLGRCIVKHLYALYLIKTKRPKKVKYDEP